MYPTSLLTHGERAVNLTTQYDDWISDGKYVPWTYPFGSFGPLFVLAYLLIPHQNSWVLKESRWLVWAFGVGFEIYCILYTRARGSATAYGIGLGSSWYILWFTACLVAYDAQVDFARIEVVEGTAGRIAARYRTRKKRHAKANGHVTTAKPVPQEQPDSKGKREMTERNETKRVWQYCNALPILERLDWMLDILTNFRGVAWNWRIPGAMAPPKDVRDQLRATETGVCHTIRQKSSPVATRHFSKAELLRRSIITFIAGYFILDMVKTITIHDPYFVGYVDAAAPSYLPLFVQASPILTRCYRLLVGLMAVYWALATIFAMGPLVFVGLLGSERIGVRGEAWMYPPEWGSYKSVFDRGLAGWWGVWWHQTFRFAFEAPSQRMLDFLSIEPGSFSGRTIQLFTAFICSGFLHASGSYTSIGETRPLKGPFLFFFLQPIGIIMQMMVSKSMRNAGITGRVPRLARRLTNFAFVHVWMYWTAPLLIEDFAKGGTLLFEPCPISPMRLSGFGLPGDSWWTWKGQFVSWHSGPTWWQSGITV